MSTTTIPQLPQAVGGLTGLELVELAQPTVLANGQPGYTSIASNTAQIALLAASVIPLGPVGVVAGAPTAGANNNYSAGALFGATTGFLDLTLSAPSNLTGLIAGSNGQMVTITNLSAFNLTLNALNAGSLAANQFRLPADLILTQNNAQSFRYSTTIGKWVAL